MTFPDAWEECALVTIERFAATPVVVQCAAMTESVEINEPDYPGESVVNLAGGRIWKQSPQEDGEITLEIYPIALDIDTTASPDEFYGLFQLFATNQTIDVSTPDQPMATQTTYAAGVDRTRDRFRVSVLWTNDTTATSAAGATALSTDGLRFVAMGCRMISHKASYTDGILKVTATFKFPPMSKDGTTKMYKWESGDNTAIAALTTYDDDDSWS